MSCTICGELCGDGQRTERAAVFASQNRFADLTVCVACYALTHIRDLIMTIPAGDPRWIQVDIVLANAHAQLSRALAGQGNPQQQDPGAQYAVQLTAVRPLAPRQLALGAIVIQDPAFGRAGSGPWWTPLELRQPAFPPPLLSVPPTARQAIVDIRAIITSLDSLTNELPPDPTPTERTAAMRIWEPPWTTPLGMHIAAHSAALRSAPPAFPPQNERAPLSPVRPPAPSRSRSPRTGIWPCLTCHRRPCQCQHASSNQAQAVQMLTEQEPPPALRWRIPPPGTPAATAMRMAARPSRIPSTPDGLGLPITAAEAAASLRRTLLCQASSPPGTPLSQITLPASPFVPTTPPLQQGSAGDEWPYPLGPSMQPSSSAPAATAAAAAQATPPLSLTVSELDWLRIAQGAYAQQQDRNWQRFISSCGDPAPREMAAARQTILASNTARGTGP